MVVLDNLIANAAKFSKKSGQIIISTIKAGNSIKVLVQDFGVGIKNNDKNKIFKSFSACTSINRMGISSSGLGLSIVKKIIEKHDGTVAFDSEEGKGTCFFFTLPLHH